MRTAPTLPVSATEKQKLELKMSHANQMVACTALPTLGRNQSLFDTKNDFGMQDLDLGDSMNWNDTSLDLLADDDEDEDEDEVNAQQYAHMALMSNHSEKSTCSSLLSSLSEKSLLSGSSNHSTSNNNEMDDCSARSTGSARSSGSGISEFLSARVSTFTKNMDTIAEMIGDATSNHER